MILVWNETNFQEGLEIQNQRVRLIVLTPMVTRAKAFAIMPRTLGYLFNVYRYQKYRYISTYL